MKTAFLLYVLLNGQYLGQVPYQTEKVCREDRSRLYADLQADQRTKGAKVFCKRVQYSWLGLTF